MTPTAPYLQLYTHWRLDDAGMPMKDGVTIAAFPSCVAFVPKMLELHPEVYGFEDSLIVVRAVNGTARYRPTGATRDAHGHGPVTILAEMADLMVPEAGP